MGGEIPPNQLFQGVVDALDLIDDDVTIVLLLPKSQIKEITQTSVIQVHEVEDHIEMSDDPLEAVRKKRNSSLIKGIELLDEGAIDALVTIGNTGALIAGATLALPRLPGIHRPALLALLPSKTGVVSVVDVGGNVSCQAHHLVQFAQMGVSYARTILAKEEPKIGLLNIGGESQKGTAELKLAHELLAEHDNFYGNIEPAHVFEGKVDVLVTNGVNGNIFLKASEGMAAFICDYLDSELNHKFNYAEYPGAVVCGLERLIIKCHGHSTPQAIKSAIVGAVTYHENGLISHFKEELAKC